MEEHNASKQAILLMTHFYDDAFIGEKYARIVADVVQSQYDVFILLNTDAPILFESQKTKTFVVMYHSDDLLELGYTPIRSTMIPGSCHFPLMAFYLTHRDYSYYWRIEYDVHFTSNWSVFFSSFHDESYDFISSHVEKYDLRINGNWHWWRNSNHSGFSLTDSVKSFNPICRCSNRALSELDGYLKLGYAAHEEVIMASFFYNKGFSIADLGGVGEFVPMGFENRFYISDNKVNGGSMRYRPPYRRDEIGQIPQKLYHPVKFIVR